MTLPLLENELVKKYFGWESLSPLEKKISQRNHDHPETLTAYRILQAMCEPIKKGDRYLGYWFTKDAIQEDMAICENSEPYHPVMLRLPDAFQAKKEKCESDRFLCFTCRRDCKCTSRGYSEKPDPVEEMIKIILSDLALEQRDCVLTKGQLRELVELVRKQK